ncbi:Cyclin [Venustampulla echinocandica]|uniref:Cyclin n=1 Tax=Venustampulla echinocandica TaxID=2656787 RepID=A0A370TZL8_9HELO|nr:Cyclin [Venustampulla echinocandica]RDL40965.1 Cyclin [Venustampulla echinocandica]
MNGREDDSPPYIALYGNGHGPYSSSIASSASSSSASVWSDSASQSSDDSSVTSTSDSEPAETYNCPPSFVAATNACEKEISVATYWPKKHKSTQLPPQQQRQHPRRTSAETSLPRCPPSLVRQSDRKVSFVDSLVDSSAQIVEAIWPLSSVVCRNDIGNKGVLPLRTFIQETLRRSRTSYSTLQVALYYLILIKPHVPKHDFTMEQPDDAHSIRALQCGRRMFLSALILASKYLQDRNFSARAWSKISGLNTLEINQNEMAFLLAVNWQLHITDAVFQRWTDIVLKYTPTQPPSAGAACPRLAEQSANWKLIILKLNPALDNVDGISPSVSAKDRSMPHSSPRSLPPMVADHATFGYGSNESTPTPKYYAPSVMEPCLPTSAQSRPAPAPGLLPTPRLTPQSSGFNTPAVSAASYILGKSAMGCAMAQASTASVSQLTERWPTSSPQSYVCRRSSLASSVSSMSSPESMVSDTSSRSSRSSSISSASSLMSAPISTKLDVQARCRYAKLCSERQTRTVIAPVPEYGDNGPTSSPESYTGPVGKDFVDLSLDTPLAKRDLDADFFSKDEEAARALQELHNHPRSVDSPSRAGAKRSRPQSIDNSLQENVREMLSGRYESTASNWSENLTRSRALRVTSSLQQVGVESTSSASVGRKRVCCATEATRSLPQSNNLHPALGGFGGPGMWEGILN